MNEVLKIVQDLAGQNKTVHVSETHLYICLDILIGKDYQFVGQQFIEDIIYRYYNDRTVLVHFRDGGNPVLSGAVEFLKSISQQLDIPTDRFFLITYTDLTLDFASVIYLPRSPFAPSVLSSLYDQPLLGDHFKYHFGCLVGRCDLHRFRLVKYLIDNHKDKSLVSCHFTFEHLKNRIPFICRDFFKEELDWAETHLPILPQNLSKFYLPTGGGTIRWQQAVTHSKELYEQFFIDIVLETDINSKDWTTEKIYKNFVLGRPFILLSGAGSLQKLKGLGFKTFDKIIDESYDTIKINQKRVEHILKEIDRISTWTVDECRQNYYELEEILVHNRKIMKTFE